MRSRIHAVLAVLLVLFLVGVTTACGASQRERTIAAALIATNASRDAFITFDDGRQKAIVDGATSLDDGKAKLAAYYKKRAPVVDGFAAAYRLVAAAAVAKDAESLKEMLRVLELLKQALTDLTGGKP